MSTTNTLKSMDRQRILDDLTALGRSLFRDMKRGDYDRTYDAVLDMVYAFNLTFPERRLSGNYPEKLHETRNQIQA